VNGKPNLKLSLAAGKPLGPELEKKSSHKPSLSAKGKFNSLLLIFPLNGDLFLTLKAKKEELLWHVQN